MKKIGILFGQERTFPTALVERINSKNISGILAEPVLVEEVMQNQGCGYAVILDRISQDVPFYRAFLKNAAATGTAVINNPFWWSADEKYFNNVLAEQIGVPVPKTVLLPSKDHPTDTSSDSFTNLKFPLDWGKMFGYVGGFPAWMKPHSGGGWKSVYKVNNPQEVFDAYDETEQLVMMLQEGIEFDAYFRCYCIGGKYVKVMHYEPRNPHHLRYDAHFDVSEELMQTIENYVFKLNKALGYDFNTVEFAVRDGIPYAIDFCNPAPDADINSVGQENFEWVVETAATYLIERAQAHKDGQMNLTWGTFIKNDVMSHIVSSNGNGKKTTAENPTPAASVTTEDSSKKTLLNNIGTATVADKDDLKAIKGIGPKLEKMLHSIGIYTFDQVSKMTKKEYDIVDSLLNAFQGRAQRDDWAGQATKLMQEKVMV